MQQAKESTSKLSKSTSQMFNELITSDLNKKTSENIKNSRELLQSEEKKSSKEMTEASKHNLSDMLEQTKKNTKEFSTRNYK